MNFFTHITIGKYLYLRFSKKERLRPMAFLYGNIKPDLFSKCLSKPHTLENYLFEIHHRAIALNQLPRSSKAYSKELGIICHYICDFFCYYHLTNDLHHQLYPHFKYEWKLHTTLLHRSYRKNLKFKVSRLENHVRIPSLIMKMRKEYANEPKSIDSDIKYAFLTSIYVCDSLFKINKSRHKDHSLPKTKRYVSISQSSDDHGQGIR